MHEIRYIAMNLEPNFIYCKLKKFSSFAKKLRNVMSYLTALLLFMHRERKCFCIKVSEPSAACNEFSQVCCYFFFKD